ncbi:hypothetical protein HDU98_006032 [Podochytrium sp. JEL0797]|nr:hypothetical protein HDU98_006032 [Podochytrium sp. JEL0797]
MENTIPQELAQVQYNQLDYDQPIHHNGQFNGSPERAGGVNQNPADTAQQQQHARAWEKSGPSLFDVYGQLEQRRNTGNVAGGSSVGATSKSGGGPVQIVYIQPETDAGVTLPAMAPPAYSNY